MRSSVMRAVRGWLLLLVLVASSAAGQPVPPSSGTPRPLRTTTARSPLRGHPLGIGEPRKPQPFTIEQRLLYAVSHDDRVMAERALEHGAKVTAKDDIGRTTVLLAVLDAGDLDLVRWLHAKGAALDEPDLGGRTALSFAAAAGRLDIVRYLIENGAAVDRADVQRRTPLFHAALDDHRDVVAFLLDRGANVNVHDQFGDTPLIVACAKGYGDMAALLLQRGADPALKDQEGRTARERAAAGTAPCLTPSPNSP
jgi:ankyrin repeat protein